MAAGDTLVTFTVQNNFPPGWIYLTFTGGSVEPTADGDGSAVIWGDTSDATSVLEYLVLNSGTWGGGDAAGYMLCSDWNGTDYQAENFTADSGTPADHGTLGGVQVSADATPDKRNADPVLDFDASTNQVGFYPFVMPRHYGGGDIDLNLGVKSSTATTGDMSFATFFRSISDNTAADTHQKNFAAPQANQAIDAATTLGATRYFQIQHTAGAQVDNIAAGESGFLLVMRDAQDSTNDDMAGDAELAFIEMREKP